MNDDISRGIEHSLSTLSRSGLAIFMTTLICGGVAYIITSRVVPSYEVHFSYIVAMQNRATAQEGNFDGYYSLSGTELFTETLAGLLMSPEMIMQAYDAVTLEPVSKDPFALQHSVRAEKEAPVLVHVTVTDTSKARAEKLALGVAMAGETALQQYNNGKDSVQFRITKTSPWTGVVRVAPRPVAIIGGLGGFFAACMVVLLRQAFRRGTSV